MANKKYPTLNEIELFKYEKKIEKWEEIRDNALSDLDFDKLNEARSNIMIFRKQIEWLSVGINMKHYNEIKKFICI